MRAASLILGAALAATASAPLARDPKFGLPVDCILGETCFITALTDHDPRSTSFHDFRCESRARDDHGGTDIALRNLAAMRQGVDVIAAAPGTVIGTRDQLQDIMSTGPNAPELNGQFCGNGVAISHGDGWVTQYCHLKQGSITASVGDRVAMGAKLGQIGLSGLTNFPHLHLTVTKDGTKIDPFAPDGASCNSLPQRDLWLNTPKLAPGGVYTMGFANRVPDAAEMFDDLRSAPWLGNTDAAIVLWVNGFALQTGDVVNIVIQGPDGIFVEHSYTQDDDEERWHNHVGRRFSTYKWPLGTYTGRVTVTRRDTLVVEESVSTEIRHYP